MVTWPWTNYNTHASSWLSMVLSSWPWSLWEFTHFIWWMHAEHRGGGQPPDQANRLGLWVHRFKWLLPSTSIIAICYYYSAQMLMLILLSHGGGRQSRPRHCRKGAQPMPKAIHHSGCRDKHNCPQPLTLQSLMPLLNHCYLQRHMGGNNLPKVVTRQHHGWELNSQPSSCKSNALTTRLPSLGYLSVICIRL